MLVKLFSVLGAAAVLLSIAARPLGAHGEKTLYRVQPHDTLWSIAAAHYAGDAREAIWEIQRANGLDGATIRPGETLVLP